MKLLITGADRPLGTCLMKALGNQHDVTGITRAQCDHRDEGVVDLLCADVDAILHCDVYDPVEESEQSCLDWASRGTYVLMQAARSAGVDRVVLASRIDMFEAYPDHFVVDETWHPKPTTSADSLAPYLAEQTCREFAREGGICAVGLRLGALGAIEGTTEKDVVAAFSGALKFEFEPNGYRWQLFHVYSGQRFPMRGARRALGLEEEVG